MDVLGESRIWPAVAIPVAALAAMVLLGLAFEIVSPWVMILLAASIVLAWRRRGDAVLADEQGLLVRRGGKVRRSYAWSEISRMGWIDYSIWGSKLQVFPQGSPYDVPGPNSGTYVASIWRPRRGRSGDPLPSLMSRHSIKSLTD